MKRAVLAALAGALWLAGAEGDVWHFDSLQQIGGHEVKVEGTPRVVDGAVVFDGVKDALFLNVHPLAGAAQWTWEAIFRPDGGRPEQRFFHLQEDGAATRMLFEIRVAGNEWWLDSYAHSGDTGKALIDPSKRHPLGKWYAVAATYDGLTFRNYVDGVMEGEAEIALKPQSAGKTSIGVRITHVDYFKGAVKEARFSKRALQPSEFLRVAH